ncbi:MAG: NAD(P)H-binding protein [Bacteroidota bacterium]
MLPKSIAIIGLGWLGETLGEELQKAGCLVRGTTRSPEKQERLEQKGFDVYLYELGAAIPSGLLAVEAILINIPPGRRQAEQQAAYPTRIAQICAAAEEAGVQRVILASSTGVYAEQGGWTTEDSPLNAEKPFLHHAEQPIQTTNWSWTILRFAGLVGGQRHPGRFLARRKELGRGNAPVNLVHREDCVAIIRGVLEKSLEGIFNVCSDEHPSRSVFYPEQAKRLGLAQPTFLPDTGTEYKRISNQKLKQALDYEFQHPDPRTFPLV